MEPTDRPAPRNRATWEALLDPRWLVLAVVSTVAAFCFIVSYSHIFDLGRLHAQGGVAARLLPLSIDALIVAATLVLLIQSALGAGPEGLARWLPRATVWGGIAATVLANVGYGLPHGWEAAVISGWPGLAFVAAVELGVVVIRMVPKPDERGRAEMPLCGVPATSRRSVPSELFGAAKESMRETAEAGNPLTRNQLQTRFRLSRAEATEIWQPYNPPAGAAPIPPGAQPISPDGAPAGASNGQVAHG